jgi:opacity protein-like surface antigen
MKITLKSAVAAIALICSAQVAHADLNVNGETGLILNPTAEIVQKGHPQIQGNYSYLGSKFRDEFFGLYGAIQAADKLEISGGVDRYKSDYRSWDRSGFDIGAKYQLFNQTQKGFDLAVGAGYDRGLNDNFRVYAAATKSFNGAHRAPVKATLGVHWDRFTDFANSPYPTTYSSQLSVYAGLDIPLVRSGDLNLIGEIQSKNVDDAFSEDTKPPYAIGLRYHPHNQAFSITAGAQRQGINSAFDPGAPRFFAQIGYNFGK